MVCISSMFNIADKLTASDSKLAEMMRSMFYDGAM